jgi:hypothetical protein
MHLNPLRRFRSGGARPTRELRRLDQRSTDSRSRGPVWFPPKRVSAQRNRTDNPGYADLERALRDVGMTLLLQFTADLVPRVLQRIVASRQRPADRDRLPPVSHIRQHPEDSVRP